MDNKDKMILDLCGGTGAWSKPYKDAGYLVANITLPKWDVRTYPYVSGAYGILAAPPCKHLAGSGARWWEQKGREALIEALSIVDACLRIIFLNKPKFWALENPVGRLVDYLGKPEMYFHPYYYGDPYTKYTCLWGKFNKPKENRVEPVEKSPIHYMPPGPDRTKLRSITPPRFAKAFYEANK